MHRDLKPDNVTDTPSSMVRDQLRDAAEIDPDMPGGLVRRKRLRQIRYRELSRTFHHTC